MAPKSSQDAGPHTLPSVPPERVLLQLIFDNADGILVVEPGGTVLFANAAAAELLRPAGEAALVGGEFGHPAVAGKVTEIDIPQTAGVAEMRVSEIDWEGAPALLASLRDVTDRKRAEQEIVALNAELEQRVAERTAELRGSNKELQEAQRIARVGSWRSSPGAAQVRWSAQTYELFGRDPAAGPATGDALLSYVHPDDRQRVRERCAPGVDSEHEFELDFRIRTEQGDERLLHAVGREDPAHPDSRMGTFQDVTDQRRAERERVELLEASAQAEAANRAKSEFLARMSHELRTPLNSIIGFSQLLQLEGLQPREGENVTFILKAGQHLLRLVNDVLDLARIESGQTSISLEPVALVETIREEFALLAPTASERHVSLHIDASGLADDAHVLADLQRFKQVLLNVLSNAIKYNHPGGRVDVSIQATDTGRVRASIADTGIGIAPEQLKKLFEPFERLGAEKTGVEGTGLGLALSKALLDAMGGTIEVRSTPGAGTDVTLELAAAQPRAGEPVPETDQQQPDDVTLQQSKRQTILYVEDNLSNLTLVERILERHSMVSLIPAMQATIGLELARQHHPDLIVLDLHLPDMPGVEVLKHLKADPPTRDIPIIVLTADASKGQAERAKALGAIEYITKPLDVPNFIEIITRNLASHPATPQWHPPQNR